MITMWSGGDSSFFLKTQPNITIVGEAANGHEAVELAEEQLPDVILMDLLMPGMDGIEATKRIKEKHPDIKVLILTSFSEQNQVIPALKAGADGYQLKDIQPDELVRSIEEVMKGENRLHQKATSHLLGNLANPHPFDDPVQSLTKRELEVLKEIGKGKSNKEIAATLFITEKTVKTHVTNILSKLGLHDRTQAALFAVKNNIVS